MTPEKEILRIALDAFKKTAHIEAEIEKPVGLNQRADYVLNVTMAGKEMYYLVEVKATVAKTGLALLQMQKEKYAHNFLLVTRYVNPNIAEELKTRGLEFIDTAGNAYINQPPVLIYVKGNKPPDEMIQPLKTDAFKPTGLKVIYAFLCNPGLENKPYRDIAVQANVALGTVAGLMGGLKDRGFLLDMGKKGKKIMQREALFQRWVETYPERLKPKLEMGRFQGELDWWNFPKEIPEIALWGGEVAANRLTQYLKPQMATVYTTERDLNKFLLQNKLKKDPQGNVEILKKFWGPGDNFQREEMVHPILVYADLIATGNERNKETARMIYEQHIAGLVRED